MSLALSILAIVIATGAAVVLAHRIGHSDGYYVGHDDGYNAGFSQGNNAGYEDGLYNGKRAAGK